MVSMYSKREKGLWNYTFVLQNLEWQESQFSGIYVH